MKVTWTKGLLPFLLQAKGLTTVAPSLELLILLWLNISDIA